MQPTRYQPSPPPPGAQKLYDTREAAEAARQSRADLEAGLRERRERKEAAAAETREARATAQGFETAADQSAVIRRTAENYARSRYRRPD